MRYLDNNAGTMMPPTVIAEINKWFNRGNPSAAYASARDSTTMMNNFRKYLRSIYGDDMEVYFTSSASESNATIIRAAAARASSSSRALIDKLAPHIISSTIEHKSILSCFESMHRAGALSYTLLEPDISGIIGDSAVEGEILKLRARNIQPALVTIMHANNETGAINNIAAIAQVCKKYDVLFHSDIVQTAGKIPPRLPPASRPDAYSITFHKCLGPVCGALLIKRGITGLDGIIAGTQNDGFRGGTENVPMIAGAFAGYLITMSDRAKKNARMVELKQRTINTMAARFSVISYRDYVAGRAPRDRMVIVIIGENVLPSTLLFSVIPPAGTRERMCNTKLKEYLASRGIIVSIGSACNTSSDKASHVLFAMRADENIRRGTIRVSLGDANTLDDCGAFVAALIDYTQKIY